MFSFFKQKTDRQGPEDPSRREFLKTAAQGTVGAGLLLYGLEDVAAATFQLPPMENNRSVDNKSLFSTAKDLENSYKKKLYERSGDFEYYEPSLKGEASPFYKERIKAGATVVNGVPIFKNKGEEIREIPRDMAILGQVKGGIAYAVLKKGTRVITVEGGSQVTHVADCANPINVGGLVKCEVIQQTQGK